MNNETEGAILADRYELGPVVGRGGMGVVRRARDQCLGRDVAIKLLGSQLVADGDVRKRFELEAQSAARLSHPAVVTVFDSGEDDDTAYLVMECLPGQTLADELATGAAPAERVKVLAVNLLGALDAAHRLGIVHRDIKPSNILMTNDGLPKLADFGIAKTTDGMDLTRTGLIVGTASYMAPELLSGEQATPASDLYSLGVVLYEALTGEKPYAGDTPMAVATAMHNGELVAAAKRCSDADPALTQVIDALMVRDPRERTASAASALDVLQGGADPAGAEVPASDATRAMPAAGSTQVMPAAQVQQFEQPYTPPTEPVEERIHSWARRHRDLVIVLVCLLVVLVLAMVSSVGDDADPSNSSAPTTTAVATDDIDAPPSNLPGPLDNAIIDLEGAVK